ncbi:MAG: hypothetical protein ACKVOH_02920, partial [Chlamydiales bacterium]
FLFVLLIMGFIGSEREREDFKSRLLDQVRECIKYNEEIDQEPPLLLIDALEKKSYVLEQGKDDLRVKFVLSQGCIEHVLACAQTLGEITELVGMIHTPMPATPLCTEPTEVDTALLDESMRHDLDKLLTLRFRAQIVREYLTKGGTLFCLYPKGGLEKRTIKQQEIYFQELAKYPAHLFDWVLQCEKMDPDMIGATYFFRDREGDLYTFSIKARQANDPQELFEWGLWFGLVEEQPVQRRICHIMDYLKSCGGPTYEQFRI